ncbi:hypothetical protein DPMN_101111 [Dreissena polymorpha]|uniref:Uncharacterized protein n=1 Tax=Dreissena polymorpha TaxID=45954 RepID=A0A9D4LGX6_DREPO|nr:hypothetical protein DPMN_101111 [Dreissena polymorpha]
MGTAYVCARKQSCVRLVDGGHEQFWPQFDIDLVVYLPVWSMPGSYSVWFVWMQRFGQGELKASCELKPSQLSAFGLF